MLQFSSQQDFLHSTGLLGNSIAKIIIIINPLKPSALFRSRWTFDGGLAFISLPDSVESKSRQMQFAYRTSVNILSFSKEIYHLNFAVSFGQPVE